MLSQRCLIRALNFNKGRIIGANSQRWVATHKLAKPNLVLKKPNEIDGLGWFLLLIPISSFSLGVWQIKRKKWKEDLIHELEYKTKQNPIPFPDDLDDLSKLEYRKVIVRGEFDHSKEMYLGPRTRLNNGKSTYDGQLMSTKANESSGYLVISPFVLSDTKERILVNRGWVPYNARHPASRQSGQIEGEIELVGVVRLNEKRQPFMPTHTPKTNIWFQRDLESLASYGNCSQVYLDATEETSIPGGPIGGQTVVSLRNEHLSYIVTWFGLGLGTSIMWYTRYLK